MGKGVLSCLLADSLGNVGVRWAGVGRCGLIDLTCTAEKVSTSDSEKPSGSLSLRNADASLGVMYVVFFIKKLGAAEPLFRGIEQDNVAELFWVSQFLHETVRPFLRVGRVGIRALFAWSRALACRAKLAIEPAPLPMLAPPPSPKGHREFVQLR
jgi:hypothetical protein